MDTNAAIDDFKYDNELSFPMANDTTQYGLFCVTGCPTTVIIDRYGLLAFVETGAITSKEGFTEVFDRYIGDDYVPSMGYGDNAGGEGGGEDIDRTPKYEMPSSSEIEAVVNGAGNDVHALFPKACSLQNVLSGVNLLNGIIGKAHTDGITDAVE